MRRFENTEGAAGKFWEISVEEASFSVRWGRVGAEGQVQTKSFASPGEATSAAEKLIREKLKKGYVETAVAANTAVGASATPAPRAAGADLSAGDGALPPKVVLLLNKADKFWLGEADGLVTRITVEKLGKQSAARRAGTIVEHPDEATAAAHLADEARAARRKGFADAGAAASSAQVRFPQVPAGFHEHAGARAVVEARSLRCSLCDAELTAVEVSSQTIGEPLVSTVGWWFGTEIPKAIAAAKAVCAALSAQTPGTVWEAAPLLKGKLTPAAKAPGLPPSREVDALVFADLLQRTSAGEPALEVLRELLFSTDPGRAAAGARLLSKGLRPVQMFNPALAPDAAMLWRLLQGPLWHVPVAELKSPWNVRDQLASFRLLLQACEQNGSDELLGAAPWHAFGANNTGWNGAPDWLQSEEHELARRVLLKVADRLVEAESQGALEVARALRGNLTALAGLAGFTDAARFGSLFERASPETRVLLAEAFTRARWPQGPNLLIRSLSATAYDNPSRARLLNALYRTFHPDLGAFALTRRQTPDESSTSFWVPAAIRDRAAYDTHRAQAPWPYRETIARGSLGQGLNPDALGRLAWELWAVTGRFVPRPDLDVTPGGWERLEAWRQELLSAAREAPLAPLEVGRVDDATEWADEERRKREEHAALHRRAKELVQRFEPGRLGRAYVAGLAPEGGRHRSAIFSRAFLEALGDDLTLCTPQTCGVNHARRNLLERVGGHVVRTASTEDDASRRAWRADWGVFRDTSGQRFAVPFTFLLWDLETYLAECEARPSEDEGRRFVRFLALFDQHLLPPLRYDSGFLAEWAKHLAGEKARAGIPGPGMLRGVPQVDIEFLLRSLLSPPFYDEQTGVVTDATLGGDAGAFVTAPTFPFPKLFADGEARARALAELGEPVAPEAKPEAEALTITLRDRVGGKVSFTFSGPQAADRHGTLDELLDGYCKAARTSDRAGEVAFECELGVSATLDLALKASDSGGEPLLDDVLRDLVADAAASGAPQQAIEVR